MNEQEAYKIANKLISICREHHPEVWFKPGYDNKPDLKFIDIYITIKVNPEHTRKMEAKR